MSTLIERIRAAQVRAAEDLAIAAIPADIMAALEKAQTEFVARGGCPGCGSQILAVHELPCSECDKYPFD